MHKRDLDTGIVQYDIVSAFINCNNSSSVEHTPLGQNVLHYLSMHVGQAKSPPLVLEGKLFMVYAQ